MLRDNLVELIGPMQNSVGTDLLALCIANRTPASDDRLPCLKNPRSKRVGIFPNAKRHLSISG